MTTRRSLVLGAALAISAAALPARAATQSAFDPAVFAAAQAAGKPILISVHADWCPVCEKQKPIVASITAAPEFKDLVILIVDFDSQKDALRALGVQRQSTMIALRGTAERDRSVGVTDPAALRTLIAKTIG
jgi:thioredoxin-like negative regulator of GroEL